jgi:hypothetical protein
MLYYLHHLLIKLTINYIIAGNRKTIVSHVYRLASPYGSSMGSLFVSVDVHVIIPSDSKKMKTKIDKLVNIIL